MCLLIIARHGNTFEDGETPRYVGLRSDLSLTNKGVEQATLVAQAMRARGYTPNSFYAGSLKRQFDTAAIVANEFGDQDSNIKFSPALQEIDYGAWEGLTREEVDKHWLNEIADWEDRFEWPIDVFNDVRTEREGLIRDLFSEISLNFSNSEAVFLATSNGILRLIYSMYSPDFESLKNSGSLKRIKVGTGCYCVLDLNLCLDQLKVQFLEWNVKPSK